MPHSIAAMLFLFRWRGEQVLIDRAWTPRSDVYSFGVLIFEIYSFGGFPFDAVDDADFIPLLMDRTGQELYTKLDPELSPDAPMMPVMRGLFQRCLKRDPHARLVPPRAHTPTGYQLVFVTGT